MLEKSVDFIFAFSQIGIKVHLTKDKLINQVENQFFMKIVIIDPFK